MDDLMFGLVADDVLYLKTDTQTKSKYDELGLEPFCYSRGEKVIALSYSQAPEETLEQPQQLCEWANEAYGAALRSAKKKK